MVDMVVVVAVMLVVVVMEGLFPINHALDVPKLLHVARDGDGTFLIETVLLLRLLQQLHEQRVLKVHHRHHKSLLLLSVRPHLYRQTPLRHVSNQVHLILLLLCRSMMMKMRQMQMKTPHIKSKYQEKNTRKEEKKRKRRRICDL